MKKMLYFCALIFGLNSLVALEKANEKTIENESPKEVKDGNFTAVMEQKGNEINIKVDVPGLDVDKLIFKLVEDQERNIKFLVALEPQETEKKDENEGDANVQSVEGEQKEDIIVDQNVTINVTEKENAEPVTTMQESSETTQLNNEPAYVNETINIEHGVVNEFIAPTTAQAIEQENEKPPLQIDANEEQATGFILLLPSNINEESIKIEKSIQTITVTFTIVQENLEDKPMEIEGGVVIGNEGEELLSQSHDQTTTLHSENIDENQTADNTNKEEEQTL